VRTIAFLLFTAYLTLDIAESPAIIAKSAATPGFFWGSYMPYNSAILACYAVMIAAPRRKIAVFAMVALQLIYAWVTLVWKI